MPKKQTFLFIIFSILFIALIGIQVYFIKNTYQLKEKEVLQIVSNQLKALDDDTDIFDESPKNDDQRLALFLQLRNNSISLVDFKKGIAKQEQNIKPVISNYIDSIFTPQGYQVAIRKEYLSAYMANEDKYLFNSPIVIYQTERDLVKKRNLTTGKWDTESKETNDKDSLETVESHHRLILHRATSYDVLNLDKIVILSLLPLIIVSTLILVAVSILYYLTYRSLRRQEKQIEVFHTIIDNISHEFKTPIATLKIANRSLQKSFEPSTLDLIERQINRLEQLLQPLQDDKARQSPLVDAAFIDEYLEDVKQIYPTIDIRTHVDFELNHQLNQLDFVTILGNLINNAVKYEGTVLIIAISFKETISLSIKDNGIGIDKKEINMIFKKYYRIQKNHLQHKNGLGLGLFLVHQLTLKNKGTIDVISKVGSGTTIFINIHHEA